MLSNTTAEMMHYIITKLLIKWEEIEATKNRIKLKYPSVPVIDFIFKYAIIL
jgi:hypothetical protein